MLSATPTCIYDIFLCLKIQGKGLDCQIKQSLPWNSIRLLLFDLLFLLWFAECINNLKEQENPDIPYVTIG